MVIVGNFGNPPNMKVCAISQNTRTKWVELVEESTSSVPTHDHGNNTWS